MSNPRPLAITCVMCLALSACDEELVEPIAQDTEDLCPPLPEGVEAIPGLSVSHAYSRFDGTVLTLSSRALACSEPAAQHERHDEGPGYGVTVGLPARLAGVGAHELDAGVHLEFETPELLSLGGPSGAGIEIFSVTDTCVTGEILGLESVGGPFDGGFRAPRCSP